MKLSEPIREIGPVLKVQIIRGNELAQLMSVKEAQEKILAQFSTVSVETVPLAQAHGRVLAQQVAAKEDFPLFDNSSMDGYAVRAVDVQGASTDAPVRLQVTADIPAGSFPEIKLEKGQTARIMTGAPLPQGADAVVAVEDTDRYTEQPGQDLPDEVLIKRAVQPGTYVRKTGSDLQTGSVVLRAGKSVTPSDVGALATLGVAQPKVYRKPRVALFSSGDELVTPETPLSPGKIRNSNSYSLAALAENFGAEVIWLGIAADEPEAVRGCFEEAVQAGADLIITSAGVSVGAYDYVRTIVEENGSLSFWRVNMRPGKPLAFGSYKSVPVIGLPGNPVSAYVGFLVFVLPVLSKLAGLPQVERRTVRAVLEEAVDSDGRESYLRGVVRLEEGKAFATLTGHQGSGNLFSLVQANALLIVPSGVKSLPTGSVIDAWLLDESCIG